MCVAIVVPKGKPIPSFAIFHRCWEANPNGAGFCFPALTEDRLPGLRIVKGLMTFTAFKEAVQKYRHHFADAENLATVDVGFHFRIASAGGHSPKLTHPFFCGPGVALMHNGHIGMLAYDDSTLSPLTGNPPRPAPPARSAKARAVFKQEHEAELARLKEMVANEEITPGEAEQYAQLYIDKNTSSGRESADERAAQAAADRLHRLEHPESDTSRLAAILSRLPDGWQRNEVCHFLIREKFLRGDKVAIFDPKGLAVILNEKNGMWDDDGRWFSNTYWMPHDAHAGRLVSGEEMLKDKDESSSTTTTTYQTRGATYGKSDRELRAKSDELRDKMLKQGENKWPVRDQRDSRGFTTPRLGCTITAPGVPPEPTKPGGFRLHQGPIDPRDGGNGVINDLIIFDPEAAKPVDGSFYDDT